jgi:WD40 repeat protein/nucleoside phosphorylase
MGAMTSPEPAHFMAKPAPERSAVTRAGERSVDVLILTALEHELLAVLDLGDDWIEQMDGAGFPYHRRTFDRAGGKRPLVVAAAWLGKMGELQTAIRGAALLEELAPSCLAMCGICAGMRGEVALGDVIVAERLYSYDGGKLVAEPGKPEDFRHDLKTYDLPPQWAVSAAALKRELDLEALQKHRPPSKEAQRRWLLHALYAHEVEGGPPPVGLPARKDACPGWSARIAEAIDDGLVTLDDGTLALTPGGRKLVSNERTLYPDGLPGDPDLQVHVGAIATGKTVREDPGLFQRLRRVVRTTVGVEMEGAAIGELAQHFETRGVVVKAVSDHADLKKDDSFRKFACRAAAEVLLAFLLKQVEPERKASKQERGRSRRVEVDPRDFEPLDPRGGIDRRDGFLARVERVALLRDPGATVTRHRAAAPFAGVLEVAVRDGELVDLRIIAAVEQSITGELVDRYQAEVELRFRQQDPLLRSMLIHGGSPAPAELARGAARRGVVLKSFGEYQRLFDFGPYLEKQTGRLDVDQVYPPSLYVEQPARWSLAGGREEQATERALATLWELLEAPHPRFALVLGDFGAGKTFLLHELARRMAGDKHPLVPVLVEMSKLEKQNTLKALLAQHFANADVGRIDLDAFHYLLAEGRIALLFDGFDELALRLTYDRALEHFETVLAAAQGNAKVVLTSRTQHFLTDQQVRRALAERAEQVPGYRLLQLEKFGEPQIRRFLGNMIAAPEEAEERYRLLDEVKDLLGLSTNPRMLGFIAKIGPEKLREAKAKSGEITAARLYEILIGQWLDFEFVRVNPPGAPKGISRAMLRELVTKLAGVFWGRNARALVIGEFREVLVAEGVEPAVVEHMIGSGSLLVRDADGRFSFVHRSVMEWLVADAAAVEVKEKGDAAALGTGEISELMADFFVSLAGRTRAEAWAWDSGGRAAEGTATKNAARVLKRAEVLAGAHRKHELVVAVKLDLEGRDLRGQDWSRVDWRGARLNGADLRGATLIEARLSGATLVGARLGRADLTGADLTGVDLAGAELAFARLTGADLRGVKNLATPRLRGAKLVGVQGVAAEGLEREGAAPPVPGEIEPMWAGASSPCNAVAWSPSGDLLVSGHDDGSVRLWDAVSGQAIRTISGHFGAVRSVAFSPDGLTVASGSDDTKVRVWEVASGRALRAFEGHKKHVLSVAFNPDGQTLASGSADNTVQLWDLTTRRPRQFFKGHRYHVTSVTFSPDGKLLASGAGDKIVRLWDVATGRTLHAFEGHKKMVKAVAFSPDGLILVSGSSDQTVRVWEVATGRALRAFEGHKKPVRSVAFSPDAMTVASGSDDKTVQMWEVATGRVLRAFKGDRNPVRSVAFSPDGLALASGSDDKTVQVWEVATGRALRAFEGQSHKVLGVAFGPNGLVLASGGSSRMMRLWEVATARALRAFEGSSYSVRSVAFSPDGLVLASGSYDDTVGLWEVASGRLLRAYEGHKDWVSSLAFSPDGFTLASGSYDDTVGLWEVASSRPLQTFEGHKDWVTSVAFSPDGLTLASGSHDNTVRLWEVSTGRTLRTFEGHKSAVTSVAFSPDGLTLASGSYDNTVRLWEVSTGRTLPIFVFEGHKNAVTSVAFSPDGLTLASGSYDKTVHLWEFLTGRVLRIFEGHKNMVSSVAVSPDGQTLASASTDGTIRLWDTLTARCLAILLATPEGWAAFTPDGRYKLGGDIAGSFWHVIGLCRFEPGELDPYLATSLRIPDDEPLVPPRPGPAGLPAM